MPKNVPIKDITGDLKETREEAKKIEDKIVRELQKCAIGREKVDFSKVNFELANLQKVYEKRKKELHWEDKKLEQTIKWLEKYAKMLKDQKDHGKELGFGVKFDDCESIGTIIKKVSEKTGEYEASVNIARIMNAICKVKKARQYIKGTTKN